MSTKWPLKPIILLAALAACMLAAQSASGSTAAPPTVTATIAGAPGITVTAGEPVRYLTTLSDNGPATITHVELALPVPAGMSVVSATPSVGTCPVQAGEAVCQIGTISAGGSATVSVIARAPSHAGGVNVTARWTADIGQDDPHQYVVTGTTTVAAQSPDLVAGYVPPTGDTLTTDPGTGATASNPQVTAATIPSTPDGTPIARRVERLESRGRLRRRREVLRPDPTDTIGQSFSPGDPLRFVFVLDATEAASTGPRRRSRCYHDSVLVPNCTGGPGIAAPDPCVRAARSSRRRTSSSSSSPRRTAAGGRSRCSSGEVRRSRLQLDGFQPACEHLGDASTAVDHPPCCACSDGVHCAGRRGLRGDHRRDADRPPDPVTVGHTAALTTTFTNTGPVSVHDVELRLSIPDGSFVQVAPADATRARARQHGRVQLRRRRRRRRDRPHRVSRRRARPARSRPPPTGEPNTPTRSSRPHRSTSFLLPTQPPSGRCRRATR